MPIEKVLEDIEITVSHDGTEVYNSSINTQDVEYSFEPIFWEGGDEEMSLSGKIRDNTRGFRFYLDLNWNTSLKPEKIARLLNKCVRNNAEIIKITATINTYTELELRLKNASNYKAQYSNTIGYNVPQLSFVGESLLNEIPSQLVEPWIELYSNILFKGFYSISETSDKKALVVENADNATFSDDTVKTISVDGQNFNINTIKLNNKE